MTSSSSLLPAPDVAEVLTNHPQVKSPLGKSLVHRPRRLRRTENLRRILREIVLTVDDLIYLLFVMEGSGLKQEVPSMPGCFRYSLDRFEITALSSHHRRSVPLVGGIQSHFIE